MVYLGEAAACVSARSSSLSPRRKRPTSDSPVDMRSARVLPAWASGGGRAASAASGGEMTAVGTTTLASRSKKEAVALGVGVLGGRFEALVGRAVWGVRVWGVCWCRAGDRAGVDF